MRKSAIVAGTGFEGRARVVRNHCKEGLEVTLKREPNNQYDKNAVAVFLKTPYFFGLLGTKDRNIGYIKSNAAKGIAKKMDAGVTISAHVLSYYAPPVMEHPRVTLEITDED